MANKMILLGNTRIDIDRIIGYYPEASDTISGDFELVIILNTKRNGKLLRLLFYTQSARAEAMAKLDKIFGI